MIVCSVDCIVYFPAHKVLRLILRLLLHVHCTFCGEGFEMVTGDKRKMLRGAYKQADKGAAKPETVLRLQP